VNAGSLRVAFFPDAYHEIDGVANTSRHFEAFARERQLPFLMVHAGPRNETTSSGSVTRIQLKRGPVSFPLDRGHRYDLLFQRYRRRLIAIVREFEPDVIQITGPTDVGTLGAMIAYKLRIPLAATWQTNLPMYARSRMTRAVSFLPESLTQRLADAAEHWSARATTRFYQWPQLLFAPNPDLVNELEAATGKPCFLMSHSVDTNIFNPKFRDRQGGPFRIGYVGRLTPEKNVRWLAHLEESLLAKGHRDFEIIVVGDGAEGQWLRKHMRHAQFTGVLTGEDLSRAFANMDVLAFPSRTETFGLVVLEAMASGVPAVVTATGGPKFTVQPGETGFVVNTVEEFSDCVEILLTQPDRLSCMRGAAREHALSTSWAKIFEGMYYAYGHSFRNSQPAAVRGILDAVKECSENGPEFEY
jgi:phosphatidylinositol alpha 1,6-mannosyltransferase